MKIITTSETTIINAFFDYFKAKTDTDLRPDFADFINSKTSVVLSKTIIDIVCQKLLLHPEQVMSRTRVSQFVDARCVIAHFLRNSGETLANIGLILGGRDHSTIIHLIERFDDLHQYDKAFQQKFKQICDAMALYGIKI